MKNKAMVPFDSYLKKEQECEELKEQIEELQNQIKMLKKEIENIIEDRNCNFKRIDSYEMYVIRESDFH